MLNFNAFTKYQKIKHIGLKTSLIIIILSVNIGVGKQIKRPLKYVVKIKQFLSPPYFSTNYQSNSVG